MKNYIDGIDFFNLEIMKYFIENKKIAAICATPTILGAHGYLKGKRYTCFPPMNKDFGGTFTGEDATIDGNLITGTAAPVILTSRSDSFEVKVNSLALGALVADSLKKNK